MTWAPPALPPRLFYAIPVGAALPPRLLYAPPARRLFLCGVAVQAVGIVGLLRRGQLHGGPVIEGSHRSLLLRPPLPRQLSGLGYLGRSHRRSNDIAVLNRFIAILSGRKTGGSKVIPRIGPYGILWHAAAFFVQEAEVVLGAAVALRVGHAIPKQGLGVVPGDA